MSLRTTPIQPVYSQKSIVQPSVQTPKGGLTDCTAGNRGREGPPRTSRQPRDANDLKQHIRRNGLHVHRDRRGSAWVWRLVVGYPHDCPEGGCLLVQTPAQREARR